jgi:hypothetical protein
MKKPAMTPASSVLRMRRLGAIGATVLGVVAFAAPAHATGIGAHADVNFSDPSDPLGHFPSYYEDAEGQRVELCVDPLNAACGAIVLPDPSLPVAFSATTPTDNNFPDEAFYQRAVADIGTIELTLGQESTFAGTDGTQAVFGRVRIRAGEGDLTVGQWYRFTYPGGQVDLLGEAGARPVNFSSDVGCGPLLAVALCDSNPAFEAPSNSDYGATFLQKDRGAGAAPPAGYLADAGATEAVVGSTFVPPGETTPANYFRVQEIDGPGGEVTGLVGQTDQFQMLVPGKLAGGDPAGILVNSDGRLVNQRVDTAGSKMVTLRNGGSGQVDLDSLAVGGPDASQFALDTEFCNGGTKPLAAGESCNVLVTFTPAGKGPREATIDATVNASTSSPGTVHSFKLLGRGVFPQLTLPAMVSYGNQLVGDTVGPRTVHVTNTGDDTMHVNLATLAGSDASEYTLGLNTCNGTDVAPGDECKVDVFFRPSAVGAHPASLSVSTDIGAKSVSVVGAGVQTPAVVTVLPPAENTPAAAETPSLTAPLVVPVVGSSLPQLALTSITGANKVKRAKAATAGIRLTLRVQDGTQVVRLKIYRKTGSARKLLSDGYKTTGTGSLQRVTQAHASLRTAFRTLGSYEVEATPGRSTSDLGKTSKFAFRIVR